MSHSVGKNYDTYMISQYMVTGVKFGNTNLAT